MNKQEVKLLQPWKQIPQGQFKFLQDVMGSHEYADLATKVAVTDLQDRLDWMWNLHQQGKIEYNQAIDGVYNTTNLSQEAISAMVSQRIDAGDSGLHLTIGSKCDYIKNGVSKKIEITNIAVDFGCASGGLYPINISFKLDDDIVDEWFDCFGRSVNGDQLVEESLTQELSADELSECHQYFIENLYANFRWTAYAHQESSASTRIKFAKELWEKFQAEFNLIEYPITQEAYNSLVMTFAETHLKAYE